MNQTPHYMAAMQPPEPAPRTRDATPYFWLRKVDAPAAGPASTLTGDIWLRPPRSYWLVDFRGGNHANVFNGQRWHSERAARHAIALIDPGGQHPVRLAP